MEMTKIILTSNKHSHKINMPIILTYYLNCYKTCNNITIFTVTVTLTIAVIVTITLTVAINIREVVTNTITLTVAKTLTITFTVALNTDYNKSILW